MTNITWTITQCDRLTSDGFITTAHWTCSGVDGEFSASIYSTCSFPAGTPSIPYAQVTEAEVLNWCWAGGVDKDATETAVQTQIDLLKNPPVTAGVPWATAA